MGDILENSKVQGWIRCDKEWTDLIKPSGKKKKGVYTPEAIKAKKKEDDFGHGLLLHFPCTNGKKNTTQWTTRVGEGLVKLLLEQCGYKVNRPQTKTVFKTETHTKNMRPDWETDTEIIEVKTRKYTVQGTIGEKILGTPWKYRLVKKLYGKPLKIILLGYQEWEAKEDFQIGSANDDEAQQLYKVWEEIGVEYIYASKLLDSAFRF